MGLTHSSNPVLSEDIFEKQAGSSYESGRMTVKGTTTKGMLYLAMVILTATLSWKLYNAGNNIVSTLMVAGGIGAFVCALITSFKPEKAKIFGSLYALCEGLLLGGISAIYNEETLGIVSQAVVATFGVTVVMLLCYRFGVLRASGKFSKILLFATLGIGAYYLLSLILGFFGVNISVYNLGPLGIAIQLIIVIVAALNLIWDFESIDYGVESGAPEYI